MQQRRHGGLHEAGAAEQDLTRAVEVIRGAPSLALACHVHPDGDALGSLLAMHLLCEANGVHSVASWPEPFVVGPHYRFLPGLEKAVPPWEFPPEPPVMLTFDLGSFARLGGLASSARAAGELVVLDHHDDNQRFGSVNVVWTGAPATTVVVRELARRLGWSLTPEIACNLYVGLVTDTGRFRYPNTTPEVFALAEELTGYGLSASEIVRELFDKHRYEYLLLEGEVVRRALLDPELGLVIAWVTRDDLERYQVAFDETEGLIDQVRQTAEADVACVLKEAPGEGLRVSLRSEGRVDVAAVAGSFGGGGHPFMAGFTTDQPITEVVAKIRAALR